MVYDHPTDYPDHYVARLWDALTNVGTASVLTAPTLDELRLRLPPELDLLPRQPGDDPCIVETWI